MAGPTTFGYQNIGFGGGGAGAPALEGTFFAVAGGGGAGGNHPRNLPLTQPGGGGGAGGFLSDNDSGIGLATFATATTYAISTGAGGSGGGGDPGNAGTVGNDTTWNDATNGTLTLKGGGRGGGGEPIGSNGHGGNGGSGGGAGTRVYSGGSALTLTPMQGNDGGDSNDYFQSAGGGGKTTAGTSSAGGASPPGAGGDGYTWVDGVERAIGGRGSDRQNSVNGGGAQGVTDGTGNGGASRYNSHYSGLRGSNGGCGIRFPDAYTISNPGGGLTITTTTADGLTTAIITGTGNIQFD
tara:strand:- start:615 stop:1502 length:888 start_codon:yes stop_codon:yes gene_type:complete